MSSEMIRTSFLVCALAATATLCTAFALGFAVSGEWPFADRSTTGVAFDFLRDSGVQLFFFHTVLGLFWIRGTT